MRVSNFSRSLRSIFVPSLAAAVLFAIFAPASADPTALDRTLALENKGKSLTVAPMADDLTFLRRSAIDLIGRIPSVNETSKYMGWPASQRREKWVDHLLSHERFTDRWTTFFADTMRIRSNATGGNELLAYVYKSLADNRPYDEMVFRMISSNGKAGKSPEVGYILAEDADPMALASATAQTFLGIRIACAQCHDHPFDMWTQEEFYSFAAFFGKTRRVESRFSRSIYTTEQREQRVLWPPMEPGVTDRKPVAPEFLYKVDKKDIEPYVKKMLAKRAAEKKAAAGLVTKDSTVDDLLAASDSKVKSVFDPTDALLASAKKDIKKIDTDADLYRRSELRHHLGTMITDPYNRYFSWSITNRVWKELVGRGFVEPVDDFRFDNKPSHPKTLNLLSNEFVGSGFDFRFLVKTIVMSDTYQRGRLIGADEKTRQDAEAAFVSLPMRRMISEALFDSIVTAGHLFDYKWPSGAEENVRTIRQMVRVPVALKPGEKAPPSDTPAAVAGTGQDMAMAKPQMVRSAYNLEQAIEVDFNAVLKKAMEKETPEVAMMQAKSTEQIEAERMAMANPQGQRRRVRYMTKYVDVQVNVNPKFSTSYRMASPAPRPHFLRVFGQPGRTELGDFRDDNPSMRQALMMLNGSLTHEASRVGPHEQMHKLLTGSKADLGKAIQLAYREILTRDASSSEIAFGKEVITAADNAPAGMADLRWALLNSNEFRYIP